MGGCFVVLDMDLFDNVVIVTLFKCCKNMCE